MFITFIIPTIGRDTLTRTLQSLFDQTDPDWSALVIGDHVDGGISNLPQDNRVWSCNLPVRRGTSNHGGQVRNVGIAIALSEWVGFVDDDDRLDPRYVETVRKEASDCDLWIFKMKYPDGLVLPPGGEISGGQIGISFSIRMAFVSDKGVWFNNSSDEDFTFINNCQKFGARVKISKDVGYYIRH
jgi:glycosyltransferase involved in cell wall biosynthesis